MSSNFDIIIKNGNVIDPAGSHFGEFDIAIKGGRIAAVERNIPPLASRKVIDARDNLVLPGLVDAHTHIYAGSTFWGIQPDSLAWRTGVTTWIDAGSAGAYNIEGLKNLARGSSARIRALLNISAIGLVGETGELRDLAVCDADLCAKMVSREAGFVVGIKARMSKRTVGGNGVEPLRRAVAAGGLSGAPVMVHIGASPPSLGEVIGLLRPGDIITHCMCDGDMTLLGDDGTVRQDVRQAVESGVVLDVGHGSGSFSFSVAKAMIEQGFAPKIISSDLHARSVYGPAFDLPTCMSKMLMLGMSVNDVVNAVTAEPAKVLGISSDAGSLAVGSVADVAIFSLEDGSFTFYDINGESRVGSQMFFNTLTILGGEVLEPQADQLPPEWIDAPSVGIQDHSDMRRPRALEAIAPEQFPRSGAVVRKPSTL